MRSSPRWRPSSPRWTRTARGWAPPSAAHSTCCSTASTPAATAGSSCTNPILQIPAALGCYAMEEGKQLRGIVAKRLSHLTEATTHLVTETETTEAYVKRKNIQVVAATEDLDVSGGKPIRERPGVGPWLTLDRLDEW